MANLRDDSHRLVSVIHQDRQARALRWISQAELPPGAPVLEIGPGAGLMTVALAQRGFQVTAIDAAPEMSSKLPCPAGAFCLVVALGVVPWLHRADTAIAEMARVLRPGGYLIVNADNRYRLNLVLDPRHHPAFDPARVAARSALRVLGVWRPFRAGSAVTAHRLGDFDRMLSAARLEVVRRSTFGFGPFTMLGLPAVPAQLGAPLSARLQRLADDQVPVFRSGGNQYLVLARRRGL